MGQPIIDIVKHIVLSIVETQEHKKTKLLLLESDTLSPHSYEHTIWLNIIIFRKVDFFKIHSGKLTYNSFIVVYISHHYSTTNVEYHSSTVVDVNLNNFYILQVLLKGNSGLSNYFFKIDINLR